ncbi:radical SAM domain-containing protein [Candidatus Magnetobacterium bavaricum]|uniref:Radical SAM domain-containing protein n=1 Tax=Candidatus Magnetobacterium bavaricum TaxID=29290 RepID=A0A0F3GNM0_9BACT|nr:radical SAM domain-containing protein [Candidatus Magnetobacterium bavaricum]
MTEAYLYNKLDDGRVECFLCAHRCVIADGRRGLCGVRENRQATLYSLVYGKLATAHIDPIEKKPLYHFHPASKTLSIATVGCNFRCLHCQNADLSQYPKSFREDFTIIVNDKYSSPAEVIEAALNNDCRSVSYTYSEPTVFFEFALECAKLAREKALKNVFVSNGFMTPESVQEIIPYLDANNIDLKGDDEFYRKVCGGRVEPVKDTIRRMAEAGVWVEVTTLVIPGYNDSEDVLRSIADFICSVNSSIPWHVTRFHPTYKMTDRPWTSTESLTMARQIGLEAGLRYVYQGNAYSERAEDTRCPSCKTSLIKRHGFSVTENILNMDKNGNGLCPVCSTKIDGVW